MTNIPLVTVICTCYNHELYVEEAIHSVLNQTYKNIQLIVVDNASKDNSVTKIEKLVYNLNSFQFIKNETNLGICKAFNEANKLAKGKYLIDLAADDILVKNRIELQVAEFELLGDDFAIIYSNVEEIDKNGTHIKYSLSNPTPPSENIFLKLLASHFIPSPSTIFRKKAFDQLGGYNEELAFEDFDFWVKCSYQYKIHYLDSISTKKRILENSLSTHFYSSVSSKMLDSTFQTFNWAREKISTKEELNYFNKGASYYFRQAVFWGHFDTALKFKSILETDKSFGNLIAKVLLKYKINISCFYTFVK